MMRAVGVQDGVLGGFSRLELFKVGLWRLGFSLRILCSSGLRVGQT